MDPSEAREMFWCRRSIDLALLRFQEGERKKDEIVVKE